MEKNKDNNKNQCKNKIFKIQSPIDKYKQSQPFHYQQNWRIDSKQVFLQYASSLIHIEHQMSKNQIQEIYEQSQIINPPPSLIQKYQQIKKNKKDFFQVKQNWKSQQGDYHFPHYFTKTKYENARYTTQEAKLSSFYPKVKTDVKSLPPMKISGIEYLIGFLAYKVLQIQRQAFTILKNESENNQSVQLSDIKQNKHSDLNGYNNVKLCQSTLYFCDKGQFNSQRDKNYEQKKTGENGKDRAKLKNQVYSFTKKLKKKMTIRQQIDTNTCYSSTKTSNHNNLTTSSRGYSSQTYYHVPTIKRVSSHKIQNRGPQFKYQSKKLSQQIKCSKTLVSFHKSFNKHPKIYTKLSQQPLQNKNFNISSNGKQRESQHMKKYYQILPHSYIDNSQSQCADFIIAYSNKIKENSNNCQNFERKQIGRFDFIGQNRIKLDDKTHCVNRQQKMIKNQKKQKRNIQSYYFQQKNNFQRTLNLSKDMNKSLFIDVKQQGLKKKFETQVQYNYLSQKNNHKHDFNYNSIQSNNKSSREQKIIKNNCPNDLNSLKIKSLSPKVRIKFGQCQQSRQAPFYKQNQKLQSPNFTARPQKTISNYYLKGQPVVYKNNFQVLHPNIIYGNVISEKSNYLAENHRNPVNSFLIKESKNYQYLSSNSTSVKRHSHFQRLNQYEKNQPSRNQGQNKQIVQVMRHSPFKKQPSGLSVQSKSSLNSSRGMTRSFANSIMLNKSPHTISRPQKMFIRRNQNKQQLQKNTLSNNSSRKGIKIVNEYHKSLSSNISRPKSNSSLKGYITLGNKKPLQ